MNVEKQKVRLAKVSDVSVSVRSPLSSVHSTALTGLTHSSPDTRALQSPRVGTVHGAAPPAAGVWRHYSIIRDTLSLRVRCMWRLVTLTLVGGMSRLRVRDSRLSAVSLSPLSLSRSRRHRLRTQSTRRLASPSRVTLTSRVRISHRAVKPPRRAAARM